MDAPGHIPCSVMVGSGTCLHPGVPVHHDPVDGILANPGNREWVRYPLSFFVVCAYPIHRVMVNWDPPISQYLGQPGTIQKGNTSIGSHRSLCGTVYSMYSTVCGAVKSLVSLSSPSSSSLDFNIYFLYSIVLATVLH